MYSMNNIKFTDVQQTKAICDFNNTENKHRKINADIWYNKMHKGEKRLNCVGATKLLVVVVVVVVVRLPDDSILVPKHVVLGSWYKICFVACSIVLQLVHLIVF